MPAAELKEWQERTQYLADEAAAAKLEYRREPNEKRRELIAERYRNLSEKWYLADRQLRKLQLQEVRYAS